MQDAGSKKTQNSAAAAAAAGGATQAADCALAAPCATASEAPSDSPLRFRLVAQRALLPEELPPLEQQFKEGGASSFHLVDEIDGVQLFLWRFVARLEVSTALLAAGSSFAQQPPS